MKAANKHTRNTHTILREIGETAFEIKRSRQSSDDERSAFHSKIRRAQSLMREAFEMTMPAHGHGG